MKRARPPLEVLPGDRPATPPRGPRQPLHPAVADLVRALARSIAREHTADESNEEGRLDGGL